MHVRVGGTFLSLSCLALPSTKRAGLEVLTQLNLRKGWLELLVQCK